MEFVLAQNFPVCLYPCHAPIAVEALCLRSVTGMLRHLPRDYTHAVAPQTERNASVDRGATFGLGVDGKAALNEFQPLPHVVETKPWARLCRSEIKAHAAIADQE